MSYVYRMVNYSAIIKTEIMKLASKWMKLKNIIPSKVI